MASKNSKINESTRSQDAMREIRKFLDGIGSAIYSFLTGEDKLDRAMAMSDLWYQISNQINDREGSDFWDGSWHWVIDIFVDNSELFAITTSKGKLYRVSLSVDSNNAISLGELEEVIQEFRPIEQSVTIKRNTDGSYRVFLLAATNVINKNGFIDSGKLFDDIVDRYSNRAEDGSEDAYIDFFHLGKKDFYMGNIDFVARDNNVLLVSALLEDSELTEAMVRSFEEDPEYWGSSISFYPIGQARMFEVAKDIKIPVYDSGQLESTTILPEKEACSLFTAVHDIKESRVMEKRVEEALRKLAGDDEELFENLASRVDGVNRNIEDENLIRQQKEAEAEARATESEEEEQVEEEEQEEEQEEQEAEEQEESDDMVIELDDEMVAKVASAVASNEIFTAFMQAITEKLEQSSKSLEQLTEELNSMRANNIKEMKEVKVNLEQLSKEEQEKKQEWLADLPSRPSVRVGYRPKENEDADSEEVSYADIASATLAEIE